VGFYCEIFFIALSRHVSSRDLTDCENQWGSSKLPQAVCGLKLLIARHVFDRRATHLWGPCWYVMEQGSPLHLRCGGELPKHLGRIRGPNHSPTQPPANFLADSLERWSAPTAFSGVKPHWRPDTAESCCSMRGSGRSHFSVVHPGPPATRDRTPHLADCDR
jgi:hypothetical protein